MSRSVKAPVWVFERARDISFIKRQAGKVIRQIPVTEDMPSDGHYRRYYRVRANREYNPKDISNLSYRFTDQQGNKLRFIIK